MQNLLGLSSKFRTFINIDRKTKFRFIQAYIYTGIARGFILFVPFNKLRKRIGENNIETPDEVGIDKYKIAKNIGWVVIQASKYTPWNSKCLVQAFTVQRMLKERGISTTLYLGVKKDIENNMLAHAWIRCGTYIVTGGANKAGYVVVAKFSN